jgi:hypothetical protein
MGGKGFGGCECHIVFCMRRRHLNLKAQVSVVILYICMHWILMLSDPSHGNGCRQARLALTRSSRDAARHCYNTGHQEKVIFT